MFAREIDRARITSISVANDAHSRIAREHALEATRRCFRSVRDDDHAGMLRIADADAAAIMNRNPGRAGRGVDERIQQRPIRDRVAAVDHPFGLAIRATRPSRYRDGRGRSRSAR